MFKNFRWQIAFWYVGLSTVVYVAFCFIGGLFFYNSLCNSMDEELKTVASQIGHAIDLSGKKPTFRDWLRVVKTEPARSIMSMQLFDESGNLLEKYGPPGIPKLFSKGSEVVEDGNSMRIFVSPLLHKDKLIGFLQLQLSTTKRFEIMREFLLTISIMAPFVLAGFGLCGYIVSGIAVRPIENLVKTLKRFVADAGHELNTPISILQAKAQTLDRKLGNEGRFEQDIAVILSSTERMGNVVGNLMLLAELDGKHVPPTLQKVCLAEICQTVMLEFEERFSQKGLVLRKGVIDEVAVLANRESIRCVLTNLLDNAFKNTEEGGCVTISCSRVGDSAVLSVKDTGIGIPQDSIPLLFDRFYRVDTSRSRSSGGTGLGLSIVKAMLEQFEGRVVVHSEIGVGSEFVISLPLFENRSAAQNLHTMSVNFL
ncbi:MAG: HAMP domain-containing sensor histidine kinase [Candidatus Melainabacteria bacterium]|nr:HAMP domain-containing sensor histidine kinase [Candidatus Melainabacteria bacterium]